MLALPLVISPSWGRSETVARDSKQFPRCVEDVRGQNIFFHWKNKSITRNIKYAFSDAPCSHWKSLHLFQWKSLDAETKLLLPADIQNELSQIEAKTNELRDESSAAEFIEKRNITTYTRELNRELTPKYGPIFSAQVFKAIVEQKQENRDFRQYILKGLRQEADDQQLSQWKDSVKLVVSFGLGWSADYGVAAPTYIKNFLSEIESLGFEVVYLDKNPFGTIKNNVKRIIPQLESELRKNKTVVFLSLCKGTPELLSALRAVDPVLKEKIVGHINLSGMLTGTFFADIAASVLLPKIFSPIMKIFPMKSISDAGKMAGSTSYMKSTVIEETLKEVKGVMPENMMTVNITGAPMSDRVLSNGSAMAPVLKYNYWQKFLVSANDGFIELPYTLIPEELAPRQVSLVLDSSHMLSDGYLDEFSLRERDTRIHLYQSILRFILKDI
jgi:hypothetical protein